MEYRTQSDISIVRELLSMEFKDLRKGGHTLLSSS